MYGARPAEHQVVTRSGQYSAPIPAVRTESIRRASNCASKPDAWPSRTRRASRAASWRTPFSILAQRATSLSDAGVSDESMLISRLPDTRISLRALVHAQLPLGPSEHTPVALAPGTGQQALVVLRMARILGRLKSACVRIPGTMLRDP